MRAGPRECADCRVMIIVACSAIFFKTRLLTFGGCFGHARAGWADGHPRAPSVERGEAQSKKIPCCWHSQRAFPCAGHPIALCPGSWQAARCARSACVWRGRVCERQGVRITVVRAGRAYCCCCDARDAENVPGRHVYMSFSGRRVKHQRISLLGLGGRNAAISWYTQMMRNAVNSVVERAARCVFVDAGAVAGWGPRAGGCGGSTIRSTRRRAKTCAGNMLDGCCAQAPVRPVLRLAPRSSPSTT